MPATLAMATTELSATTPRRSLLNSLARIPFPPDPDAHLLGCSDRGREFAALRDLVEEVVPVRHLLEEALGGGLGRDLRRLFQRTADGGRAVHQVEGGDAEGVELDVVRVALDSHGG